MIEIEQLLDGYESAPYAVECARCGTALSSDEAFLEEGDEWECEVCNERENEREARGPLPWNGSNGARRVELGVNRTSVA